MRSEFSQLTIEAPDKLLDRERQALLEGDLEHLVTQLEEKEALIERLNECEDAGGEPLNALQVKVLRNQALLDSALQGIRSVASRMSALHRIRRSLDTYDESGRKTTIESLAEPKVEKRA
ncbi:flagellar biosynthesis protein FlgN [Alisedimentitalea sp. MJ-SS2]|uniref:flagellar biosynthesis protein FlgN n=1 Tax=Aliisedimentitalea sp. MJ-SS2 TaxID=3049795 RepID=UPI002915A6C4|nr:flagellar biosynthesis protein FlgN [Alisedimentitalea sp. MJ-SS2]MDU8929621.1 flagellar biosynthesis protein FlgN [Alisedimentitalea sp. MJ-SS2]